MSHTHMPVCFVHASFIHATQPNQMKTIAQLHNSHVQRPMANWPHPSPWTSLLVFLDCPLKSQLIIWNKVTLFDYYTLRSSVGWFTSSAELSCGCLYFCVCVYLCLFDCVFVYLCLFDCVCICLIITQSHLEKQFGLIYKLYWEWVTLLGQINAGS